MWWSTARRALGAGVRVSPFATIGMPPQDLKYKGEPTGAARSARAPWCANTSTIHRASVGGAGVTRVGAGLHDHGDRPCRA